MRHHSIFDDNAVSPVVSVMLMLMITLILAAVVSAFAGSMVATQNKVPEATVLASEFRINEAYDTYDGNEGPNPVTGKAADIYLVFDHAAGDPFGLDSVEVQISSQIHSSEKTLLGNAMTPNDEAGTVGDKTGIDSPFSKDWDRYLEKYPDGGSIIQPGDRFVLHADYAMEVNGTSLVCWCYKGAVDAFEINEGDALVYTILDKKTGVPISTGSIMVPSFEVAST
jgi:flagellin-like protein